MHVSTTFESKGELCVCACVHVGVVGGGDGVHVCVYVCVYVCVHVFMCFSILI